MDASIISKALDEAVDAAVDRRFSRFMRAVKAAFADDAPAETGLTRTEPKVPGKRRGRPPGAAKAKRAADASADARQAENEHSAHAMIGHADHAAATGAERVDDAQAGQAQ